MALSTSDLKTIAKAAVAAAAVAAGCSSLYVYFLHRRLRRTTLHVHKICSGSDFVIATKEQDEDSEQPIRSRTVPDDLFASDLYHVVYDRAWRNVSRGDIPSDEELMVQSDKGGDVDAKIDSYDRRLLTTYLRYNMANFARYLPQAWVIKQMLGKKHPEMLPTFDPEFIQHQDFVVGDVVCGIYKVVVREDAVVEFAIEPPAAIGDSPQPFEGRLVIGIQPTHGDLVQVFSETTMWRDIVKDPNVVMPLERTGPRIMHELASWWLLDSGVRHLRELKRT